MVIAPGAHLGPYQIESLLGSGGSGEVYRARDTRLPRSVAVKVLRAHLASDPDRRARFEREARAISALSHPHICRLFDIGHQEGIDYLVLELLDGETLGQRLLRKPLSLEEALDYAAQIAGALAAAHRLGIVHRDLKPANIVLTTAGAKLLDFGIATGTPEFAEANASRTLTAEGTVLGTMHYMAPEQLEGRGADPRTDLFAFGAVLYEMLTGRRAFPGDSPSKVIVAVLDQTPPSIAATQRLTPPALEHLVMTCLAKNPDERWQTASDVKRQLTWIAATVGAMARPSTHDEHVRQPRTRNRVGMIAMLVGGLLLGMLVSVVWFRPPSPAVPREARLEISTASTATSRQASLAISPDGLTVAFVADWDGRSTLWVRPLDGAARPLEGTVDADFPFWSPDSRSLGFFAEGKLKRIDVKGGAAQVLADALDPGGGSWGRDGTIAFTQDQISPIRRVAAAGGQVASVTQLATGQTGHLHPQILDDGIHVIYFASGRTDVQGVYVSTLDGTSTKLLLKGNSAAIVVPTGFALFLRAGVLLAQRLDLTRLELTGDPIAIADRVAIGFGNVPAASASNSGDIIYRTVPSGSAYQLTLFDRSGQVSQKIGNPDSARAGGALSLSPDGRRVAFDRRMGDATDLWLLDFDRATTMSRLTFHGGEANALWSRDGQWMTHNSSQNGGGIFRRPIDRDQEEPLVVVPEQKNVPSEWSPDGRTLLYIHADPDTHLDIWALPFANHEPAFPVVKSPLEDINPQFGPDGTWLLYQSSLSGRYELYVRPFPDAGPSIPITSDGAMQPRLRRDGKEVFFLGLDRWLMALPIAVSANGRSVKAGLPVRLFQTKISESRYAQRQYDVSSDGQRFLFDVPVDQISTPIVLVQHWRP